MKNPIVFILRYIFLVIIFFGAFACSLDNNPTPTNMQEEPIRPVEQATGEITLINDEFEGKKIVIAGSAELNFVVSFENEVSRTFTPVQGEIPVIMMSEDSSKWDIFGKAVAGPAQGKELIPTHSLIGFWMTFGSFYPGVEIYEGNAPDPGASILESNSQEWLVPAERVFDGGPGKDGIPSVDNPEFAGKDDIAYLQPEDLIVGIKRGEVIKAYPHRILDWHEIVNDRVGTDLSLAVTYCPLTGTASGWNRMLGGEETTFGVSGLLYNTNLIPYDRKSDSYWSQMRFDCIFGENKGEQAELISLVETTWQTWVNMYPETEVMTVNTGFVRNYAIYPYGDYRTNGERLIFPLEYDDSRLGRKDRVHAVIVGEKAKVYPMTEF
ncbi:MAG: DUF3179 domain-containing protein [Bacteroidia bacterium]|nr:DUF3179 domain-containing protein [Bacteroidia bacterium]